MVKYTTAHNIFLSIFFSSTCRFGFYYSSFIQSRKLVPHITSKGLRQWKAPMALSGIEPAAFRLVAQCPSLKVTIPYAHMFDYWERHCGFQSQTSNINKKLSIRRISGEKISMRWDCAWPVYNKLTAWSTVLPQKLKNPQLVKKKNPPHFMEPELSSPHLQQPAICLCPEQQQSSSCVPNPLLEQPL